MRVPIAILQEMKVTGGWHIRHRRGYTVLTIGAPGVHQGRVTLMWEEKHPSFEVEAAKIRSPNVLTFQLVKRRGRFYANGCYIAPGDTMTVEVVCTVWADFPQDCRPMLLRFLNANLRDPVRARTEAITNMVDEEDLVDLARCFLLWGWMQ